MDSFKGKEFIAVLVLSVLAILSWLPRLAGPIDLRWDGAAYYVLGTALAGGKGYRLLNEPGEIQTTLHPPMLPLIVALHQLALQTDDIVTVGRWLRCFSLIIFVAYVIATYFMLRLFLPPGYSVLAGMICLLQLHTVFMSDLNFPEIQFSLATVLFTLCNAKHSNLPQGILRAALSVIAFALRTIGIALLVAWMIESVFQRRYKQAVMRLVILLVPVICWIMYIAHVESGQEYKNLLYEYQRADYAYVNVSYARNMKLKDPFIPELGYATLEDRFGRFFSNLSIMPITLGEAVSVKKDLWSLLRQEFNARVGYSMLHSKIVDITLICLVLFIAGGIWHQLASRQYFIPFYTLLSMALICVTPWQVQFNRYMAPLAPFLVLSFFLGLKIAVGRVARLMPSKESIINRCLICLVITPILVSQFAVLVMLYTKWHQKAAIADTNGLKVDYRLFFYYDIDRATDAGLDWIKKRARGGEVIAATNPQWAYLRTGVKSVLPPLEIDVREAQRLLDSVPIRYLMVDDGIFHKYTSRVVAENPARWLKVYTSPSTDTSRENDGGKIEIYERVGKPQIRKKPR
ncbi:MAG: hypothetical protein IPM55_03180 [Acidobacteria bacterium]|nr:hypothetical protein [Acidobacteriota bacterium]